MTKQNLGVEFEKLTARIQQLFDPDTTVLHNQRLIDRHGQSRQFDVVIKGHFAGNEILGIIECKDTKKRVGTPEMDAFITKSEDVKANFKMMVSRNGFTKTAIEKAFFHGIQTMSLLPEETETGPYIGTWFFVDSFDWTDSRLLLKCVGNPVFNPDDLTINSKKIVSWFFNYLLENNNLEKRVGWHVVQVDFDNMQIVETKDGEKLECFGIRFSAFRATVKREKLIRITGDAFYDWQTGLVKLPVGGHVSAKIPLAEIDTWPEVQTHQDKQPGYLYNYMETYDDIFAKQEDAIDLQALGLIEIYHVPA